MPAILRLDTLSTPTGETEIPVAEIATASTPILATGSTAGRALSDRFADIVNVKDFGAKGDGSTDDTAAFLAAMTKGVAYVPAGNYFIASTIAVTLSPTQDTGLVGTGPESSRLVFADGAGIRITEGTESFSAGDKATCRFEKLGLETRGQGTASAISLINSDGGNAYSLDTSFSDLRLSGVTNDLYWSNGIYAESCTFANFRDILYQGKTTVGGGTAIFLDGQKTDASDVIIDNLRVHDGTRGVQVNGGWEGVHVSNTTMLSGSGLEYGINWENYTGERNPYLSVDNTHINSTGICIRAINVAQVIVSSCLLYVANIDGKQTRGVVLGADADQGGDDLSQIKNTTIIGVNQNTTSSASEGVQIAVNQRHVSIDISAENLTTGINAATDTGVVISPTTRLYACRTFVSGVTGTGEYRRDSGSFKNLDLSVQYENSTDSRYDFDISNQQLRVGTAVFTAASTTETRRVELNKQMRTGVATAIVCFGSNPSSDTARVTAPRDNTAYTNSFGIRVTGLTVGESYRINYVAYGY
ncbi:glycosyl hydrolase family 28-related protein [Phytohalomonas tamaricis]|uniref:glycosyl hydrolase family 28-related protein n=1 Tax=Phytohalomonas tamaricis TaxID=2081032 RepID=UPI000D0B466D|nr:glycosyl hydrolase family 28-related protein [Phytohalomonas tamaricis]